MKKYIIPEIKLKEFLSAVKRFEKKSNIVLDLTVSDEIAVEKKLSSGLTIFAKSREITLNSFEYKQNDWTFVATIQHTDLQAGNIIRAIDFKLSDSIPAKYKTSSRECEHCNHIRNRKDTYLVYNNKTEEFKQVGSSCLLEYTESLSVVTIKIIDNFFQYLELISNYKHKESDIYDSFFGGQFNSNYGLSAKEVKPIIFAYVKSHGYVSKDTAQALGKIIFARTLKFDKKASDKELEAVNKWVATLTYPNDNSYMHNAITSWLKEYVEYRDLGLISSFMQTFFKQSALTKLRLVNDYVGQVKDKIEISNIASIRTLYRTSYSYNAPDYIMYEIIDSNGFTYVWSSAEEDLESKVDKIIKITATIKAHKEYRGVKQTQITRGKVEYETPSEEEIKLQKEMNDKALQNLEEALSYFDK